MGITGIVGIISNMGIVGINVDHLVTTHQGMYPACSSCLQQSLIEKVDW